VRRFVFAPRWVFGHVLVVVAVASCLLLAQWQWGRAEVTHSLQNMAYALQWPLFAVFFAVMWWRMLRLESQRLDEEAEFGPEFEAAGSAESVASDTVGSDTVGSATVASDTVEVGAVGSAEPVEPPSVPEQSAPPRAEQPVRVAEEPADEQDDDPELAAYNRMLAALAVRDREAEAARGR
jgi:DNA-binding transcriptional regulator of glucitol operon